MRNTMVLCLGMLILASSCSRDAACPSDNPSPEAARDNAPFELIIANPKEDADGQLHAVLMLASGFDSPAMIEIDPTSNGISWFVVAAREDRRDVTPEEWVKLHHIAIAGGFTEFVTWPRRYVLLEARRKGAPLLPGNCYVQEIVLVEKEPYKLAKEILRRTGKPIKVAVDIEFRWLKGISSFSGGNAEAIRNGQYERCRLERELSIPPGNQ